jgi:DNA-binding LytR/AlgR family response regulator
MSKTNILIVEDESIVAKDIQHSLKKLGYTVVDICSTGESAVTAAEEKKPDLILMDIMLKGEMSGIDAANIISERWDIPVIFLTAYADESTFSKAKITEPYGYIIKPFKEVENKEGKDIIFIKSNSRLVKVKTSDIYFIEALKDYVTINTNAGRYTIHSTMKDIESKLSPADFIRVHRSFIVRIDKISSIEPPNLIIEDDKKVIPIGGSYKDELIKKINLI